MFRAQADIEAKDEGKRLRREELEDDKMLVRKAQKNEKKKEMKLAKGKKQDYQDY